MINHPRHPEALEPSIKMELLKTSKTANGTALPIF